MNTDVKKIVNKKNSYCKYNNFNTNEYVSI